MARGDDAGGLAEDGGEDQGVQRAPGVQPEAADLEVVRSGVERDAGSDDAAEGVVFGVGQGGERLADLVGAAAGCPGELAGGDRLAAGQQPQQRLP